MDKDAPVSMIESRTHVDHPRKHGRKFFFAFVIIFAVLVVGLMAATYFTSGKKTEEEEQLDVDTDDTELIVAEIVTDNTSIGDAFWKAATSGATVKRSECEGLINYGNQYVEAFGGTKINGNLCQETSIKVAGKQISSNEYPYEDLMTIYVQAIDKCIVAPFYEGFYGIQGYQVTEGKCTEAVKSVGVTNE